MTVRSSEQRRHRLIEEAAVNFFQGSGVIFKICTAAAWQIGEGNRESEQIRRQLVMQTDSRSSPIRVLAVDDHPLLREGIAALIGSQADMRLVGEAGSASEALKKFRATRPDVTLMDLQMPDGSGIDAIIAIRAECPGARIIVLTTYGGDALAGRALRAGAQAYLLAASARSFWRRFVRSTVG